MTTLEPRLHGRRAAQLRAAGIDTWVDSAGDTWTWDAFRIRYVRTAAGARRYGVPIGAPIPAGKRVGHKTLPNGATRVRLTPAQRAIAGRVFGPDSGPNGADHTGGVHLDVDHPADAAKALDKSIAEDDLTPGQKRSTKVLRDKVAGLDKPAADPGSGDETGGEDAGAPTPTPTPETAPATPEPEPAGSDGPLPTVDEALVEQKASAIESATADAFEAARTSADPQAPAAYNAAVRAAVDEQFPDASDADRAEVARAIIRSSNEQLGPTTGVPQPGRGTRLAVRAQERKDAARGKDVHAAMTAAREIIGEPQQFGRTADGGADYAADGGPGPDTMRKLQALRDAGAVLSAEVDRRRAADQARADADSAAARDKFMQDMNDYKGRSLAFQDEVAAALTQQLGAGNEDEASDLVSELVTDPGARSGSDEQNAFLDQYRDRAAQLAGEREQMRAGYSQLVASRGASIRSAADIRREVLAEQRTMGGVTMRYRMGDGVDGAQEERLRETLGVAESSYPKDWLRKANAYGGSQGMLVTSVADRAGYYPGNNRLETGHYEDADAHESVIIHELGHAMESSNRHLMAAQWAFLSDRVSRGGEPGSREFDNVSQIYADTHPDEIGYKDDFRQHYTGKTYDGGGPRQNHEILTTAMEDLMSGVPTRSMDGDMDQFMLGLLGLL